MSDRDVYFYSFLLYVFEECSFYFSCLQKHNKEKVIFMFRAMHAANSLPAIRARIIIELIR